MNSFVVGIDPGLAGAVVVTNGKDFRCYLLPVLTEGKDRRIHYKAFGNLLAEVQGHHGLIPVFLERAVSFGMGTKAAFNYGRGFEAIVIALETFKFPLTLVEPGKWAKEMHAGISADIKAKAKSLVAVKRLYPGLWHSLPEKPKGGLLDGPVDALLIAGYGQRLLNGGAVPKKARQPRGFL